MTTAETRRGPEPPDISEKGGMKAGQPQRADTRLFMQLLVFGGCSDSTLLINSLEQSGLAGVLYEDVNDPRGIALLTFSDDPAMFLDQVRPLLKQAPFASLVQKPEYTMLGRTYSLGLRARSDRHSVAPAQADGTQSGMAVGDLVSAAPQRAIRSASDRGTTGHSGRARGYRHVIRRCGSCPRYPSRVPRPGQGRQRFRDWTHWKGSVSALSDRSSDAKDAADFVVPRAARAVFRGKGDLAERSNRMMKARQA